MKTALLPAILCLLPVIAAAQAPSPTAVPGTRIAQDVWTVQMENPQRQYAVRLGALQTVTLQDFDMRREGQLQRVVEVTIETSGGNQARFFWEDKPVPLVPMPNELKELDDKRKEVQQALRDLTGAQAPDDLRNERVVKDYPLTTHSDWAEFRLNSEEDVRQLHRELMQRWAGQQQQAAE